MSCFELGQLSQVAALEIEELGSGEEKMMPWGAPWAARRTCAVVITKMLEIAAA